MLPKVSPEKQSDSYRKMTATEEMELTQRLTRQSVRNTRLVVEVLLKSLIILKYQFNLINL